jgi:hypothetical protein
MAVSGQLHVLAAFSPEKNAGPLWIGGWVSSRAGLVAVEERKVSGSCRNSNSGLFSPCPSLYRLSSCTVQCNLRWIYSECLLVVLTKVGNRWCSDILGSRLKRGVFFWNQWLQLSNILSLTRVKFINPFKACYKCVFSSNTIDKISIIITIKILIISFGIEELFCKDCFASSVGSRISQNEILCKYECGRLRQIHTFVCRSYVCTCVVITLKLLCCKRLEWW